MNFRKHLDRVGWLVETRRQNNRVRIQTRTDLINATNVRSSLYWIETNMPVDEVISAIYSVSGVKKRVRKTKPKGIGFTKRVNNFQIIYVGTENNLQKRLLQHLFNEGNKDTTKMSMKIDCGLFSKYEWYISCVNLKDYPTRYAIEAWWRLNIGWPPFCLK